MPETFNVSIVNRPTLHLKALIHHGRDGWRDIEVFIPAVDAFLTEPVLDPQGEFLGAEIRNHANRTVWTFRADQHDFYKQVKAAIAEAMGHA